MNTRQLKTTKINLNFVPESYDIIKVLGEGGFGAVLMCRKPDSEQAVAVKIVRKEDTRYLKREAIIGKHLMKFGLDKSNILKFHEKLYNKHGVLSLEYELLDRSLKSYFHQQRGFIPLEHIRIITRDLATAFHGLKSAGVIHCDLKLDNIMFIDQLNQPFRVKVIDFGMAKFRCYTKEMDACQILQYRAPELLLGLLYSEAIDIWSLGINLCLLAFNVFLFPGTEEFEMLHLISQLLGPAPQHMLNASKTKGEFFKQVEGSWILQTPQEYWGIYRPLPGQQSFHSLDQLKEIMSVKCRYNSSELEQFVDLLKAMLVWDPNERITPIEILQHQFITGCSPDPDLKEKSENAPGSDTHVLPAEPFQLPADNPLENSSFLSESLSCFEDSSLDSYGASENGDPMSVSIAEPLPDQAESENQAWNWISRGCEKCESICSDISISETGLECSQTSTTKVHLKPNISLVPPENSDSVRRADEDLQRDFTDDLVITSKHTDGGESSDNSIS